jgi:hypothetical protein
MDLLRGFFWVGSLPADGGWGIADEDQETS